MILKIPLWMLKIESKKRRVYELFLTRNYLIIILKTEQFFILYL